MLVGQLTVQLLQLRQTPSVQSAAVSKLLRQHEDWLWQHLSPSDRNDHWTKILWQAAVDGKVDELNRLLRQGADKDSQHQHGMTGWQAGMAAAHFAACSHRPVILRALIAAGANVEIQNKNGRTPARVAAYHGSLRCLQELEKGGANLAKPDVDGKTPLDIAQEYGKQGCVDFLKQALAK